MVLISLSTSFSSKFVNISNDSGIIWEETLMALILVGTIHFGSGIIRRSLSSSNRGMLQFLLLLYIFTSSNLILLLSLMLLLFLVISMRLSNRGRRILSYSAYDLWLLCCCWKDTTTRVLSRVFLIEFIIFLCILTKIFLLE